MLTTLLLCGVTTFNLPVVMTNVIGTGEEFLTFLCIPERTNRWWFLHRIDDIQNFFIFLCVLSFCDFEVCSIISFLFISNYNQSTLIVQRLIACKITNLIIRIASLKLLNCLLLLIIFFLVISWRFRHSSERVLRNIIAGNF